MSNSQVYKKLYKSYVDAYPNKSKAQVKLWPKFGLKSSLTIIPRKPNISILIIRK
ncbi:hypothetical protein Bhyg_17985, partial [Pseudolycoriella hygida]